MGLNLCIVINFHLESGIWQSLNDYADKYGSSIIYHGNYCLSIIILILFGLPGACLTQNGHKEIVALLMKFLLAMTFLILFSSSPANSFLNSAKSTAKALALSSLKIKNISPFLKSDFDT